MVKTVNNNSRSPADCFRRFSVVFEGALAVFCFVYLLTYTLPHAWQTLNTDFPNYYLMAHSGRVGGDVSRAYEWIWLQRQKDHLAIDQQIVALVPITPFSTLVVWPVALFAPLLAKHWWLLLNLVMLLGCGWVVRSLTGLCWRRVVLVVALNFPLHRNFLFGQYYALLLLLLALACWCYVRGRGFAAGLLVGIAAGLKIFPVICLLYFLRRRNWRGVAGGLVGGVGSVVVSVLVFGWQIHRTYVWQVLPWVLRGEGFDPYNLTAASISSLLHRLFVYEPQWNPHPALQAAWLFSVLHPLLQMAVVAPALLLVDRSVSSERRIRLEWAGVMLASLAVSTAPGSYLFTLLIFPVCVLWREIEERKIRYASPGLIILYLVAVFPGWRGAMWAGWRALLAVPRLYALVFLCMLAFGLLWRRSLRDRELGIWAAGLVAVLMLSIWSNLRHQRGLYEEYRWRLAMPRGALMAVNPVVAGDSVHFVAMLPGGYRLVSERGGEIRLSESGSADVLSVAAAGDRRWAEDAGTRSVIVSLPVSGSGVSGAGTPVSVGRGVEVEDGESPVASADGRWLAYLREEGGRGRLWVRDLGVAGADRVVSPAELNVFEMSFLPDGSLIFAAARGGGAPRLFVADREGIQPLVSEETRYPAVSPDGRWMAYSRLERGNWGLWLRDMKTGESSRLSHAECNYVQPAWAGDSKTLVYASDCGRALWFTALSRRRVVP